MEYKSTSRTVAGSNNVQIAHAGTSNDRNDLGSQPRDTSAAYQPTLQLCMLSKLLGEVPTRPGEVVCSLVLFSAFCVQSTSEMGNEALWLPYERAYTENSVLMPWIPRRFYQLRWALMNHNPLTQRFFRGQFTYGEALVTLLIVVEMLWILIYWAADKDGFRKNVRATGVCLLC
jgi:hypothetical protein